MIKMVARGVRDAVRNVKDAGTDVRDAATDVKDVAKDVRNVGRDVKDAARDVRDAVNALLVMVQQRIPDVAVVNVNVMVHEGFDYEMLVEVVEAIVVNVWEFVDVGLVAVVVAVE